MKVITRKFDKCLYGKLLDEPLQLDETLREIYTKKKLYCRYKMAHPNIREVPGEVEKNIQYEILSKLKELGYVEHNEMHEWYLNNSGMYVLLIGGITTKVKRDLAPVLGIYSGYFALIISILAILFSLFK